jgi:acetyl-CoA C-acetyltransferase
MNQPVIIAGARTPIGRFNGGLSGFSAQELGGFAIAGALAKAGVSPDQVDYVYMGQVVQAGQGQMTARQAAVNAGIPMSVPATTINKVCLSGLNTIYLAHQMIAAGDADIVVAGGMESMSNAPFLLPNARRGYGYGNAEMLDSLYHDGLYCAFDACAMGLGTERYVAADETVTRLAMDTFAALSHERAAAAQKEGLRPAFSKDGSITAANASQISDGASAIIMMSMAKAQELGLTPIAELVSFGQVAGPDSASLLTQPSQAINAAMGKAGMTVDDLDLVEINEAFAAVGLCSMAELGIDETKVNVDGGAISLGHPIGMSGNRLALHLIHELHRRGGGVGAAALCGGGGQGDAGIFRTL